MKPMGAQWKALDYQAFLALCDTALELGTPKPSGDGLLPMLAQSHKRPQAFRDFDGAHQAIQRDPIYQDIKRKVPAAINCLTTANLRCTAAEFRFLRRIARQVYEGSNRKSKAGEGRPDKEREKDRRALAHIARRMTSIQARFDDATSAQVLERLIATAQQELGVQARAVPGPKSAALMLRELAGELHREFGILQPALLVEIATASGIDLMWHGANRYCTEIRKRAGKAVAGDRNLPPAVTTST